MKYLFLLGIILQAASCTKFNNYPSFSDDALQTIPSPPTVNISYTTVGSITIQGVTSYYLFDTLHINGKSYEAGINIWLEIKSRSLYQDSSYILDGITGGVNIYDNLGNTVGMPGYTWISFYPDPLNRVSGTISGLLSNLVEMPSVGAVSITFSNVSLPLQLKQ